MKRHPKKKTREHKMHNKEREKAPSRLSRFADLIFFISHGNGSSGGVVCGQRTKVKTVIFPGRQTSLNKRDKRYACNNELLGGHGASRDHQISF